MEQVYIIFKNGVGKTTPYIKDYLFEIVLAVAAFVIVAMILKYIRKARQEKFRKLFRLNDEVRFKVRAKSIDITSGYNSLKTFTENLERLEDYFGKKVYSIARIERKYSANIIRLHTENFKLFKVERFKKPDFMKTYGGISYEGVERVDEQQEVPNVMLVGPSGSGKTTATEAIAEYSIQANEKIGRRVKRIVVTPKLVDYSHFVSSEDVLMSVSEIGDYEKIISILDEATAESLKYINKGEIPPVFYVFIFDEILLYLSSGKELDKAVNVAKNELAGKLENFLRLICRAGRQLVILGTQDPSVSSCLVKTKFINKKYIGRLETLQQAQSFSFGAELLDSELKKGIFYDSVTREKIRFPIMIKEEK